MTPYILYIIGGCSTLTWEDNIKMDVQEVGWGHGLNRAGSG
jgi:hypothetical protein